MPREFRLGVLVISLTGMLLPLISHSGSVASTSRIAGPEKRESCERAYAALPSLIRDDFLDSGKQSDFVAYKAQLLAYDEACFDRLDSLRLKTQTAIRQIAGLLFLPDGAKSAPICVAFRLNTQLIATARHCLWWKGGQLDATRLQFRLLAEPAHIYRPTAVFRDTEDSSEADVRDLSDIVLLRVDTSRLGFDGGIPEFRSELPYREFLLVPGFSIYSYWYNQHMKVDNWDAAMRVDKSPSCVRFPLDEGPPTARTRCVVTQCQTLQSMSGSPIFGYDRIANRLYVGGVHLRGGLQSEVDPKRECGNHAGFNIGITLPQSFVQLTKTK